MPLGVEYLRAGSLGFPMLMVLYAVSGSLRGMGNTWMPMVILIIVNLINAVVTFAADQRHRRRSRRPGVRHRLRDGRRSTGGIARARRWPPAARRRCG